MKFVDDSLIRILYNVTHSFEREYLNSIKSKIICFTDVFFSIDCCILCRCYIQFDPQTWGIIFELYYVQFQRFSKYCTRNHLICFLTLEQISQFTKIFFNSQWKRWSLGDMKCSLIWNIDIQYPSKRMF